MFAKASERGLFFEVLFYMNVNGLITFSAISIQ